MNIPKAILILTDIKENDPELYPDDEQDAVQLGIEALKRCGTLAEHNPLWAAKPLPGETKD